MTDLNMKIEEKHNELQKNICYAVMTANFRNRISDLIGDTFLEYAESYPEITIEEISAMMICEAVNEIMTTKRRMKRGFSE